MLLYQICHIMYVVITNDKVHNFLRCVIVKRDRRYHTVKNFGGKKVWRIRTVGSLAEKTLAN